MLQLDRHNIAMLGVLTLLVLLTLWMQFILFEQPSGGGAKEIANNDPDYYITHFTSFGVDAEGNQYQLAADRLVHYPLDNKALLDRPHITQYPEGDSGSPLSPVDIYADSGWLFSAGTEILLTGNVKVIQGQNTDADTGTGFGNVATTQRMRIKLKDKK